MDKKDIYEHLAKIYLDTTPATARKKIPARKQKTYYLFASVVFSAGVCVFLLLVSFKGHPVMPPAQTSLIIAPEPIRLSFNLISAKKQAYDLDLKNSNLNGYKTLVFSLKDSNYSDAIAFRIEFTNSYKEKAEFYLKDVTNKWKEYRLDLADFKGITDWSEMTSLSFVVEEWNTREDKGILFIDNVRLLK
ncbi:MAG: hypothetical protein ACM3OC_06950 [Deltaproteobacteria bacterium]